MSEVGRSEARPTEWSKEAAILLRQFLDTPVGQLFLQHLRAGRPGCPVGLTQVESAALRAAEIAGYEACLGMVETAADVAFWEKVDKAATQNDDYV